MPGALAGECNLSVTVVKAVVPGMGTRVIVRIEHVTGSSIFTMTEDCARQFAQNLTQVCTGLHIAN